MKLTIDLHNELAILPTSELQDLENYYKQEITRIVNKVNTPLNETISINERVNMHNLEVNHKNVLIEVSAAIQDYLSKNRA